MIERMLKTINLYKTTLQYLTFLQITHKLLMLFKKKILYHSLIIKKLTFDVKIDLNDIKTNQIYNDSPEIHALLQRKDHIALNSPENEFTFNFLNKPITFIDSINWHPEGVSFLWRYNLHYFDYAYDLSATYLMDGDNRHYKRFKLLVTDWCNNNPLADNIGWDPYPASLRIVNWIKAHHLFSAIISSDKEFNNLILLSLYRQALFLENNVEYHLLNNHIIENGKALYIAGSFFNGRDAERWKQKGLEILWQELKRQVAEDGGQFELSPMYHTVVLLNYIEVVNILRMHNEKVPAWVSGTINKMVIFLKLMSMPDNEIAYFNDSAKGMTVPVSSVFKALELMGYKTKIESLQKTKSYSLPESGYYIIYNEKYNSKCIFDSGLIGPDYQPGHGHCDTLSFVWAYQGQSIIIDSGVDDYYDDDIRWRNYYRSTRAHNTVEIDGIEQSEIWGRFRVGRRAHPLSARLKESGAITFVQASHDGYMNLPGKLLHQRTVAVLNGNILIIFDKIEGKDKHSIKSYLHLHPQFNIKNITNKNILACGDQFDICILPFGQLGHIENVRGSKEPVQGWYSPEFGVRIENDVIVFSGQLQMPAFAGYCIVPVEKGNKDSVSLKDTLTDDGCSLELQFNNNSYRVIYSQEGVHLTK